MAFAENRARTPWQNSSVEPAFVAAAAALFFAVALTRGAALPLMIIAGGGGLLLAIARPQLGLYLITTTVIVGDMRLTDANAGAMRLMFQSFNGTGVTPLEMLLVATAAGVAVQLTFDETKAARGGELMLPIAGLLLAIGLGAGVGLSRGADLDVLRQEIKGFLYIPLAYFIVMHTIRNRQDLSRFLWLFVVLVNIMAIEDIYRYFTHVQGSYSLALAPDLAFSHEDAIFCAAAIIILFSRIVWSGTITREWKSCLLLILPVFALLVMKRRAGIVALDGGLILLCIILLRDNFRLFLITVPIAVVFAGLLLAATWNEPGGKGQFARSFRTVTGQEATVRDQSSDEYRAVELANIRLNIQADPVTGLGFGRPYVFYIPLVDLSSFWELYPYVPHNSVMWVWMKAGIVGFLSLMGLFGIALMRSTQLTLALKPGPLKAAAFAFGAIVLMFLMYSWVDLGLVSSRALVLFGVVLGGIAAIGYMVRADNDGRGLANDAV